MSGCGRTNAFESWWNGVFFARKTAVERMLSAGEFWGWDGLQNNSRVSLPSRYGHGMKGARMRKYEQERWLARRKLDEDQRWFRVAARKNGQRTAWLREVRLALGISVAELARELKINRSAIFRLEEREKRKRISLDTLSRMADAMGCKVVYAVIPKSRTLAELAELRVWKRRPNRDGL
jgi:DNA-binding Xre family transcriptional regulator